jgi:hypothetical protein
MKSNAGYASPLICVRSERVWLSPMSLKGSLVTPQQ